MKQLIYLSVIVLLLATACSPQEPTPTEAPTTAPEEVSQQSTDGKTLVVAEISDDPGKSIRTFQPFVDYLTENLDEQGVVGGEVQVAPDLDTMVEMMVNGEVDIFIDSLYPALIVSNGSGAQPILRRWKDGVEEYHTVIFAQQSSGFSSVEDLVGQTIAFEEEFSTSGYLLPSAYLIDAGLNLVELPDTDTAPEEDTVGYVFTNDDSNTLQWVISGLVSAAATDIESYNEMSEETRDSLVILAETDPIPRQVVLVNDDLDEDLVTAISVILQAMDESEAGQEVLESFNTSQFDEFPQGIEQALEELQALYDLVQG